MLHGCSLLFVFFSWGLLGRSSFLFNVCRLEWRNEELVHPVADIERGIHAVLDWEQCMATAWIVVQPSLDSTLLESSFVEVCLMGRHAQVFVADQKLAWSYYVLHRRHGRSLEEVDLLLHGQGCEVNLFATAASVDPIRDIGGVDHVGHVEDWVPEGCSLPHVLVLRVPDQVASQEATMTASKDSNSLRVNFVTESLKRQLGQVAAVGYVILPDGTEQRVEHVLAVAC